MYTVYLWSLSLYIYIYIYTYGDIYRERDVCMYRYMCTYIYIYIYNMCAKAHPRQWMPLFTMPPRTQLRISYFSLSERRSHTANVQQAAFREPSHITHHTSMSLYINSISIEIALILIALILIGVSLSIVIILVSLSLSLSLSNLSIWYLRQIVLSGCACCALSCRARAQRY